MKSVLSKLVLSLAIVALVVACGKAPKTDETTNNNNKADTVNQNNKPDDEVDNASANIITADFVLKEGDCNISMMVSIGGHAEYAQLVVNDDIEKALDFVVKREGDVMKMVQEEKGIELSFTMSDGDAKALTIQNGGALKGIVCVEKDNLVLSEAK